MFPLLKDWTALRWRVNLTALSIGGGVRINNGSSYFNDFFIVFVLL